MRYAGALAVTAIALAAGGCSDSTEPEGRAFASLAGSWHLYECTATQVAAPNASLPCPVGTTLIAEPDGEFQTQAEYLPGEDTPPWVPGHFHKVGVGIRAAFGLDWEVEPTSLAEMAWTATGSFTFPPAATAEPATIVEAWEKLPSLPEPGLRISSVVPD